MIIFVFIVAAVVLYGIKPQKRTNTMTPARTGRHQ